MKLGLVTLGPLLGVFFASFAMEGIVIKMPNADVLRERLANIGMRPVMEKTKIVEQLAKQKKPIGYIMGVVDIAMKDYHRHLNETHPISGASLGWSREDAIRLGRQMILRALLEDDYPEALKKLIPVTPNNIGNWRDSDSSDNIFDGW